MHHVLLEFPSQGSIFTLDYTDDGFASGGKDGHVRLWDTDFKPITRVDLTQSEDGYKGIGLFFSTFCMHVFLYFISFHLFHLKNAFSAIKNIQMRSTKLTGVKEVNIKIIQYWKRQCLTSVNAGSAGNWTVSSSIGYGCLVGESSVAI
jgi:hypothetical protein